MHALTTAVVGLSLLDQIGSIGEVQDHPDPWLVSSLVT